MSKVIKFSQLHYASPYLIRVPQPEDTGTNKTDVQPEQSTDIIALAEKQAQEMIDAANSRAEEILEQAKQKMKDIYEEAYQTGFEKGKLEGYQAGLTEVEDLKQAALQEKQAAKEEHDRILNGLEEEIVELVITVARKVIHQELQQNPQSIIGLVKHAMGKISYGSEKVLLYVNPADARIIETNLTELQSFLNAAGNGRKHLEIVEDSQITPGGCLLETGSGNADARIEVRLDRIEEVLRQQVGSEQLD